MDGARVGDTAEMAVTVDDTMVAAFDDERIHRVYGTAALVRHAEQVSRRLLVPHLAAGEEGVGAQVTVAQLHPVPVGAAVTLTATVTAVTPRRLTTEVSARSQGRVVATATVVQAVVNLRRWRARAGLHC